MPAAPISATDSRHRAFFAFALFAILFADLGCSGGTARNPPSAAGGATTTPSEAEMAAVAAKWEIKPPKDGKPSFWVQAPKDDAPVVKMSAVEFGEELKSQGEALLEKYRGKWLEITGIVDSISARNREGESQVGMPGEDLKEDYTNLDLDFKKVLIFNTAEPALWKRTSRRSKITMRGVYARGGGPAGFDHGTIVSSDGPPVTEIDAADMAQSFLKDPKECAAKYHGKDFVVRGKFQEYIGDSKLPVLKGDGKIGIKLFFFGSDPNFENLKPDDPVVAYGICEVNTSEFRDDKLILNSAFSAKE